MLQIRYEHLSESYPRFRVYKLREWQKIMQYVMHESFDNVVEQSLDYPKYKHYFMLDESRFNFFRFDIFQTFEEKFTIQDLQNIINEQIEKTTKHHKINGEKISSYVDSIYVNWEEKSYLIWEKGEIFFRLYIIYLDKKSLNVLNSTYGDALKTPNLNIVPQSFHTMLFLRNNLKKENFLLLYITETYTKAIKISNGFYESVEILNLWVNSLKRMYKDNGIVQYWYKSYEFVESNPLAKTLIIQTLEFFGQLLTKWIYDKNMQGNDIIVISPITKNEHFMEVFNKEYTKYTNNYIVPFHHSDALNNFDKTWDPEDMDSLVLMNREKPIRDFLIKEE